MYANGSYIGDLNSPASFSTFSSLVIDRDLNESTLSFTFEVGNGEGVTIDVRRGHGLLAVSLKLPSVFRGNIRGLMGTFNDTPDNDLVNRNGIALPSNTSESTVCFDY